MERDVFISHGSSRFLAEKFYNHSDGYTEYICACGKPAIVNHSKNTYKCKYCGDNAQIFSIPTSWTAKLFHQEQESCNVGLRRFPRPFVFPEYDDINRTLSQIDDYSKESITSLIRLSRAGVYDTNNEVDNTIHDDN